MSENICLIGNPNCGKTSLFNALTGSFQKTGNWSGVTVERKVGNYKKDKNITIVDLPGIYSLIPVSNDEKEVVKILEKSKPTRIINVVDGTNLERGLFLTCELLNLGIPMMVAVNFCDQISQKKRNLVIDKLKAMFGVEFIFISAKKGENIEQLMSKILLTNKPSNLSTSLSNNKEELAKLIKIALKDYVDFSQSKGVLLTNKIDKILLHRFFGIPILFCIIFLIYFFSFRVGGRLSNSLSTFFEVFGNTTKYAMKNAGIPYWFISLFTSAVFTGVGSVLAFTPQILLLFLFMTILEESGYAMRITFLLNKLFCGFGLGGKSCLPIILSCGCSVTGIMATRTLENESERKSTIFLASFMPCGAKTAVFGWFSYVFFDSNALIATSMYFVGFISIILFGKILKRLNLFNGKEGGFIIEMPIYRFPSLREIFRALWEKTKDFVYKSGTVIFAVSIFVWFFSNFGLKGYTLNIEESFLFLLGNFLKIIFKPLGFGNWQATISLLTGMFAKEAVVESFELLNTDFRLLFDNNYSVYAFMCFLLVSPPCFASLHTAYGELKNKKDFAIMLCFQFGAGYLLALFVVLIGKLMTFKPYLIFCIIFAIILVALSIKIVFNGFKCGNCKKCIKNVGEKCLKK